jgi:hypothetical protein
MKSGIVLRPKRRHLGLDSWVALLIHALGVWRLLGRLGLRRGNR